MMWDCALNARAMTQACVSQSVLKEGVLSCEHFAATVRARGDPPGRTHLGGSELRGKAAGSSVGGHHAMRLRASLWSQPGWARNTQGRGAWMEALR